MSRNYTPYARMLALACALAGLAGCLMQPSYSVSVTTADGVTIEVPLTSGNVIVSDDLISVNSFQFAPWDMGADKPKGIVFTFVLSFKQNAAMTKFVVDDVTEAPILQVYEDLNPKLAKGNLYGGISHPFSAYDEHVKWVLNLDNNVRAYRFTITMADGSVHVLRKPIFIPAQMKVFVRTQLGVGG
jgi:hypothetical protein